ncbi:MAG TPA: aspartyl protease family protein [Pinirhizobacter sp.]|uniref:aspartyl protease family protein n=1 Tax=Pinirhizobacter sp. TaxID=2950432 RepID=UPI002B711EE4|nr:aspartyl protease family protein [Pinirhizobacter sp.]HMH66321.1 aspartyl protease family protein [Pinirhizobacter sp.]
MRKTFLALAVAFSLSPFTVLAADHVGQVLEANQTATAGNHWQAKDGLALRYAYSGQGLTGQVTSMQDVQRGRFVDRSDIGPTNTASGFDGKMAWEVEPSGTAKPQEGGDVRQLAVNEAYRLQNLWWHSDRGGATITDAGRKRDGGKDYDVLTVVPKEGKPFDAWFDPDTHLLARTVELNTTLTITTYYADYAATDGVQLAHSLTIDDGSGEANRQTMKLSSATFSSGGDDARFALPKTDLHDFELSHGATQTTVPFLLANNHVYVKASFNGSKPLNVIVDTGGHDILVPDSATALGIKVQGAQPSTGSGSDVALSGLARVQSIRVGDATLKDQPISVLKFSNAAEGLDEQGMIGYEFIARFITRFDYARHELTFIDKKHFDPSDAGTPVPFRFYHQFPEVLGSYAGIPGRFGIDTGARNVLSLTSPFAERNHIRDLEKNGAEAITGWGVGGASRGYVFRGKDLKLGDVTVKSPLTEFNLDKGGVGSIEAFPNNVGSGLLKRFVVTFDYDHQVMYLKPIPGKVDDLDTFDRSGVWLNVSGKGFGIVSVGKDTPAAKVGLAAGDTIVAVDGKAASSIHLYDLRRRLRNDAPGTRVALTLEHEGKPRNVTLVLRDLI